jgi:hypothetical protein
METGLKGQDQPGFHSYETLSQKTNKQTKMLRGADTLGEVTYKRGRVKEGS